MGLKVSSGFAFNFFSAGAKSGPPINTVGMAIRIPYNNVVPISAPSCPTNAVGAG